MKATRQESLHLEKHVDGASHWTEGASTKGQALRKPGVSGIWHWCWVLIMLSFSIPGPQREKAWQGFYADLHVEGSWISDQPTPPPPPPSSRCINPHIHSNLPPAFGDLHCRNSCQGNSLSQRERERERKWERGERGSTGEREGNQFLEKYCLSIPCQELVCVVAFFWASEALALWLQPSTPLSAVNSTMGGLGRKLTKTTAKQNEVLKCVCFCVHLCATVLWECWNVFFFQPYAYLWVAVRRP